MAEQRDAPANTSVTMLESSISSIEQGVLRYRGISVEELAAALPYEDVAWFLWTGAVLDDTARTALYADLSAGAAIPERVWNVLRDLPEDAPAVARMQVALPLLALTVPALGEQSDLPGPRKAAHLLGAFVTLAGGLRTGVAAPPTVPWSGAASVFLGGVRGEPPSAEAVRVLNQVFVLHADHELNASTFAGRVTASTRADLVTAVLAALSALRGPLHGGVERLVRAMLAAADEEGAESVVDRYIRAGSHLPGFGHSVYRGPDPRGVMLHELARELAPATGQGRLLELTESIEAEAARRGLPPSNVDLFTTVVYRSLGIPDALSPLVFATARVAGWCAHILEQYERNRLIRPRALYVGAPSRRWRDVPR
ncbi:MAG: citrate/2-methylcitrate synthase [Dehalococcoidia bacterium]